MFFVTALSSAAIAEAAPPLIDVDWTLLIQLGLFLLMLVALNKLLFRPYLKVRDARDRGVAGAREETREMEQRALQVLATYDNRMSQARLRGSEERTRLRLEGAAEERQLLGLARKDAQVALEKARKDIQDQSAAARIRLDQEAGALAHQMAKQILGREVA